MIGKILFAALVLTACAQPKYVSNDGGNAAQKINEVRKARFPSGQTVWLTWEKLPVGEELGTLLIKTGRENLADQTIIPQDPEGDIDVVLWMPSMGHGSTPVVVQKIDTGTYRVTEVFFNMPGDWDIEIKRVVNGASLEQVVFPIRL